MARVVYVAPIKRRSVGRRLSDSVERGLKQSRRTPDLVTERVRSSIRARGPSAAEVGKSPAMPRGMQQTFARGMRAEYEQLVRTGQKGSAAKTLRSMAEHPEGPMRRMAARLTSRAAPRLGLRGVARSVLGRVGGVAAGLAIPDELEAAKGEDVWAQRQRTRYAQHQVAQKRKSKALAASVGAVRARRRG